MTGKWRRGLAAALAIVMSLSLTGVSALAGTADSGDVTVTVYNATADAGVRCGGQVYELRDTVDAVSTAIGNYDGAPVEIYDLRNAVLSVRVDGEEVYRADGDTPEITHSYTVEDVQESIEVIMGRVVDVKIVLNNYKAIPFYRDGALMSYSLSPTELEPAYNKYNVEETIQVVAGGTYSYTPALADTARVHVVSGQGIITDASWNNPDLNVTWDPQVITYTIRENYKGTCRLNMNAGDWYNYIQRIPCFYEHGQWVYHYGAGNAMVTMPSLVTRKSESIADNGPAEYEGFQYYGQYYSYYVNNQSGAVTTVPCAPGDLGLTIDATGKVSGTSVPFYATKQLCVMYYYVPEARTITYNANGAQGETPSTSVFVGDPATVADNGFTWSRHSFLGWNTAPDGTGTAYAPGAQIDALNDNLTLYAQWQEVPPEVILYPVSYDANGGAQTGGATVHDGGAYPEGTGYAVLDNGTVGFVREGFTFTGWNTAPDGTGAAYAAGATLAIPAADTVLYAQWSRNATPPDNGDDDRDDPRPTPAPSPAPSPVPVPEENIPDQPTPLEPTPEVDVPEQPTPLAPAPGGGDGEVTIEEPGVPLGNLPQTGAALAANPTATLGMLALAASLAGAGIAISFSRRKEEE